MGYQNPSKITSEELQAWWRKVFNHLVLEYYNILFHTKYRFKVVGKTKIPPKSIGSYIVVSNHTSTLDPAILSISLNYRLISFMAKEELFATPKGRFIYSSLGTFSVNREKLEISTIRSAKTVLQSQEWLLGMFPEGTRSRDGQMGSPKKGVAFLAKSNKVGILPIGIARIGKLVDFPSPEMENPPENREEEPIPLGRDIIAHIGDFIPYREDIEIDALTQLLQDTLINLKSAAEQDSIR